jgi:hypothetical protein
MIANVLKAGLYTDLVSEEKANLIIIVENVPKRERGWSFRLGSMLVNLYLASLAAVEKNSVRYLRR